jgi:thioredoxin 1
MLKKITQAEFQKEVLQTQDLVLVDYWSPTCGPCDLYNEVLENYQSEDQPNLKFFKLNVDEAVSIADQEGILVLPTTKIYANGVCIKTLLGVQSSADLDTKLENLRGNKN